MRLKELNYLQRKEVTNFQILKISGMFINFSIFLISNFVILDLPRLIRARDNTPAVWFSLIDFNNCRMTQVTSILLFDSPIMENIFPAQYLVFKLKLQF